MKILGVSVSEPKEVQYDGHVVNTGIFKSPVEGEVAVSYLNLAGDGQADLTVHGGRNKAIYVYSHDHYAAWASELGRQDLEPAQFGENLTVSGGTESEVVIGDRYRVGTAQVVVTQPRLPCFKLGVRMNDKLFPNRFLNSGRVGFYLRVEEEGLLQPGDEFELLDRPSHGFTLRKLWAIVYEDAGDQAVDALAQLEHIDVGWTKRLRRKADGHRQPQKV